MPIMTFVIVDKKMHKGELIKVHNKLYRATSCIKVTHGWQIGLRFIMERSEEQAVTNEMLLTYGLEKLDEALGFIMDMDTAEGQALAHMLHSAFVYGEKFIGVED